MIADDMCAKNVIEGRRSNLLSLALSMFLWLGVRAMEVDGG
jgi:hypothetical protein